MEEKRVIKPVRTLIWNRIIGRDKWVFVVLILSIIVLLLCKLTKSQWFVSLFSGMIEFVSCNKGVFYRLAVSYISGFIMYFLTVIYAETKRYRLLIVELNHALDSLRYVFMELALELQIGDWVESEKAVEKAIMMVKQYGRVNNNHYCLKFCSSLLRKTAREFEKLSLFMLDNSTMLTEKELSMLIKIRNNKAAIRLKYQYGINELIGIEEVATYFTQLSSLFKDISHLQEHLSKRVYKKKIK